MRYTVVKGRRFYPQVSFQARPKGGCRQVAGFRRDGGIGKPANLVARSTRDGDLYTGKPKPLKAMMERSWPCHPDSGDNPDPGGDQRAGELDNHTRD